MSNLVLVYITFSNLKEAQAISEELLNEKLIVCVNIFPEVNSLYLWEGKTNSNCEVVAIMKSRNDQADKIVEKIESMHSYDQPAVVIIPIGKANKSFTNWVNNVIDINNIGV
ncbi:MULTISPECIES: divalent-cation tolerance protein CutA [Wolbachia]|uniref:Divalent-cation tolerance protein CutA n=1 Tax=Wolbachia endosymbiont of Oeneis ivallda TaxID=3171168 RepID=A0AAU7YMZ2_9RICK|nr:MULTISPECIES: divalent-cation tolerance protein CutA [Wolbachia]UYC23149.1 divalent-cation tolerance protein CutA [Wolbachia endosymbiont of Aedes aegypti]QBB83446.1 divalent-cation tolerance protein CutA [Wolbachia pipientis wAlbB]QDW09447.1 divalent-cation tolerance protein CutA [Wolbachia pipientis]QZA83643.1 divalent-cation tolerance protein CutA [Wolbachia pipientis]THA20360.1 divalent-cation tolerance protein CutA [Wolbachia endosymbiont of Aedes albopictus]